MLNWFAVLNLAVPCLQGRFFFQAQGIRIPNPNKTHNPETLGKAHSLEQTMTRSAETDIWPLPACNMGFEG